MSRKTGVYATGESDGSIVPMKRTNKAEQAAESVEGRDPAKGNASRTTGTRTQRRPIPTEGLERVRAVETRARDPQHSLTPSYGKSRLRRFVDTASSDPRQEPYAVVPHVRICAGGRPQGRSLPRRMAE